MTTDQLDKPQTRRLPRALRVAAIGGAILLALVAGSAFTNAALDSAEKASVEPYGTRVPVRGGSVNVYQHGAGERTIVMLSGYGTPSPAIDFAPLIEELDGFRVVVVEGFGYGFADHDAPPRTIENISSELHQALGAAGVRAPYTLLSHSIGGIYALYYANQYPDEVSAVIGVDASVPGQMNGLAGQGGPAQGLVRSTGLLRWAGAIAPSLIEPDGDAYTEEQREAMHRMTVWNYANPALLDEANQGEHNFSVVADMSFPQDLPVLSFIKKEGSQPRWRELHEQQVANREHGAMVELDGGHYLHWTHANQIASTVRDFLATTGKSR